MADRAADAEREALAWLFGFADQERGVGWNPAASPDEHWKLGRTRTLLDLAGAPDRAMRCVLVAGTKGKGSTAALLASILSAAGVRAGLYTQPHLQVYRERVRVDGAMIAPDAFAEAVDRCRRHVDRLRAVSPEAGPPTTFELTTALALDHFARAGCQVAVLEVGLGGRLDATNAVEPALSVVTSISRDHTAILGTTLKAIATEKAGILRPGRLGLLAEQRPSAARALARCCRRTGACCRVVPPLETTREDGEPRGTSLLSVGRHQRQNAALAVAAARVLAAPPDAAIRHGLARLRWPGRFEVVDGRPPVVLDGAHNDASAAALARTLGAFARGRPIHLVLGMQADKDARALLRPLLPLAASVVATATVGRRALPPADVARVSRQLGARTAVVVSEPEEAIERARLLAGAGGLVCVTGSLALVGRARTILGLPPAERLWEQG